MAITFGSIKASLAYVLQVNPTDDRVLEYCNDSMEQLLYSGKWKDTTVRYACCVNSGCLTWPREIETIEKAAICSVPITPRTGWYEMLPGGPGIVNEDSGIGLNLVDRGSAVAFDDIITTGKKIAVYCDANESAGAKILLRYYDSTGNKVYSTVSGEREEGEYITLPAAGGYAYSTYEVLPYGLYAVIKPVTNRQVRLYEYTIVGGALRPLAYYAPDETVPEYRRSIIPCLVGSSECGQSEDDDDCDNYADVTIIGKIRFIPAINDNSILCIPFGRAIKLGVQAIKKEEDNMIPEAEAYWQKAYQILNDQLHHWQGDGVVQPISVESPQSGICNMI